MPGEDYNNQKILVSRLNKIGGVTVLSWNHATQVFDKVNKLGKTSDGKLIIYQPLISERLEESKDFESHTDVVSPLHYCKMLIETVDCWLLRPKFILDDAKMSDFVDMHSVSKSSLKGESSGKGEDELHHQPCVNTFSQDTCVISKKNKKSTSVVDSNLVACGLIDGFSVDDTVVSLKKDKLSIKSKVSSKDKSSPKKMSFQDFLAYDSDDMSDEIMDDVQESGNEQDNIFFGNCMDIANVPIDKYKQCKLVTNRIVESLVTARDDLEAIKNLKSANIWATTSDLENSLANHLTRRNFARVILQLKPSFVNNTHYLPCDFAPILYVLNKSMFHNMAIEMGLYTQVPYSQLCHVHNFVPITGGVSNELKSRCSFAFVDVNENYCDITADDFNFEKSYSELCKKIPTVDIHTAVLKPMMNKFKKRMFDFKVQKQILAEQFKTKLFELEKEAKNKFLNPEEIQNLALLENLGKRKSVDEVKQLKILIKKYKDEIKKEIFDLKIQNSISKAQIELSFWKEHILNDLNDDKYLQLFEEIYPLREAQYLRDKMKAFYSSQSLCCPNDYEKNVNDLTEKFIKDKVFEIQKMSFDDMVKYVCTFDKQINIEDLHDVNKSKVIFENVVKLILKQNFIFGTLYQQKFSDVKEKVDKNVEHKKLVLISRGTGITHSDKKSFSLISSVLDELLDKPGYGYCYGRFKYDKPRIYEEFTKAIENNYDVHICGNCAGSCDAHYMLLEFLKCLENSDLASTYTGQITLEINILIGVPSSVLNEIYSKLSILNKKVIFYGVYHAPDRSILGGKVFGVDCFNNRNLDLINKKSKIFVHFQNVHLLESHIGYVSPHIISGRRSVDAHYLIVDKPENFHQIKTKLFGDVVDQLHFPHQAGVKNLFELKEILGLTSQYTSFPMFNEHSKLTYQSELREHLAPELRRYVKIGLPIQVNSLTLQRNVTHAQELAKEICVENLGICPMFDKEHYDVDDYKNFSFASEIYKEKMK